MDILDLVALMKEKAKSNPQLFEFEQLSEDTPVEYILAAKIPLTNYFFKVIDGYTSQNRNEAIYVRKDIEYLNEEKRISRLGNIIQFFNDWIKAIERAISNDEGVLIERENRRVGGILYKSISYNYLSTININHFLCIKDKIILNDLADKKEIYFLGENGDGKTLILQAILIALKWDFIDIMSKKEYTGRIVDVIEKAGKQLYIKALDNENLEYVYRFNMYKNRRFLQNIFAYGVHRSRSSSKEEEKYGFMTLFDDSQYLKSPTDWLLKIKLDETEESYQGIKLTNAVEILEQLLDDNVKIKINGSKVKFIERGFEVDFDALSEGYKSVMTWVADLVSRLSENQPEVKQLRDYQGIVLVDEISLHLHPKWEYELVRKLRGWFPNIQFIMTTHSPVTVLGASEEAVFFKVYKENGVTKVRPYEELQVGNMRADQILTSEFFGLASARPAYLQEYMDLRKEILTKTELTKEDEEKLKKLEDRYGTLPTGETKEELKTMAFLQKIAKKLNVDDKN